MKTSQMARFSSVCLTVCMLSTVTGDYIVEVRVHSYNNPGSLLASGSCCDSDNFLICAIPGCDNVFQYCLRSLGSPRSRDGCDGARMDSQINVNDAPLNFSNDTVLGLSNPLLLRGLTREWTGVQFLLEVREHDDGQQGAGDLVGRVVHNIHNNISLGVETVPSNYSYPSPLRSSIVLSFKVVCAENYYGQNCSLFCNGSCTCGLGSTEDRPNSYTCICNPGYTGENCDINIDECQTMSIDCSENGQCIDSLNTFTCVCDDGYTGTYCETEINKCESLNITCSGRGQCMDEANSFNCVCDPNFTGETCSETLQVPVKNVNLKAVLGGTIGLLVFLVISLLLVVGAMAIIIRGHRKKGRRYALSASTDALAMDENETDIQTQTIDNIAYEGITSSNTETEGATCYSNENFHDDVPVYECI